jgi:Peptidase family M48
MKLKRSTVLAMLATLPIAAAVSGQAADVKETPETKPAKEQVPPAPGSGDVQVKEIKKGSPIALVVLDKNCPSLVQPYKLTDNVASVAAFTVKDTLKSTGDRITDMIRGKPAAAPTGGDISASARLAAKQLNWLPMKAEVLYGERAHSTETGLLARDSKMGKLYYPIADKMLQDILSQVKEPHEYQFKLFILTNDTRNAVARPGGFLYIDKGLLDKPEYHPKAYFALSHEIAHVLQRHETKELQSMVVDSFKARDEMVKVMTTVKDDPAAILAHVKVGKDIYIRHHVDQELQSDSCATRLLSRVYPDRQELADSLNAFIKDLQPPEPAQPQAQPKSDVEKLAQAAHDVVSSPADRHPNTQERTQNLQAMYAEVTGESATAATGKEPQPGQPSTSQPANDTASSSHAGGAAETPKAADGKPAEGSQSLGARFKRLLTKPREPDPK